MKDIASKICKNEFTKQFVIFIAALGVTWRLRCSNMIVIFAITGICWLFYRKMASFNVNNSEKMIASVYTVFLSLALIAGKQVHYVEMRSSMQENYLHGRFCVLAGLLLAVLLFPVVVTVIKVITQYARKRKTQDGVTIGWQFFFFAWGIIWIAWLPYLLTFYPGGIVGDGALTLEAAMQSGVPGHNHWGVMYILLLRFFLWLGRMISTDINVGIYLYVIVQSLIYAAVCAGVVAKIRQKGVSTAFSYLAVAIYAMSGFFASYSMSLWKDGIFSAGVVLLMLLLWEYPEDGNADWIFYLKFVLLSLFICFCRNNGLYVLTLCVAGMVLLLRGKGRKIIGAGIAVIVFSVMVQGPGYDALGIEKDTAQQSLAVPIQQIAAVVNEGSELTEYQEEIIFSLLPQEAWRELYAPTLVDDLKNSMDVTYLEGHLGDFFKVWFQLLPSHFGTYVKAYLMQTLGFWQPGVFRGNYTDYWIGIEDLLERGYIARDFIYERLGISLKPVLLSRMQFVSSGTMVWSLFFSITAILCQKKNRRKRLLVLLPLAASWGTIMLAAPIAYAYRYIVMLPMAFPIIFILPFMENAYDLNNTLRRLKRMTHGV